MALREGVRTPFADLAGVEVVVTMPSARQVLMVVGTPRTRSEPRIPVDDVARRQRLGRQPVAVENACPRSQMGVHGMYLAKASETHKLVAHDEVWFAQALHSGLIDAAVLGGGRHHGLPFADGHRGGLLGVDVLARLHRGDGDARVPAVARRGVDHVNVGTRQQLAHVDVGLAVVVAVVGVDDLLHGFTARLPHVADGDELHVFSRQHPAAQDALSASAQADAGHGDAVGRRDGAVTSECRCRYEPRQRNRTTSPTEKRSSRNLHVVLSIQDHLVSSAAYDTKTAPSRQHLKHTNNNTKQHKNEKPYSSFKFHSAP